MTENPNPLSERAQSRARAKARREVTAALRECSFDALASGFSIEQIAEVRKVSARTIRREIDRVLDKRRLDAPDRYVHLQVKRLTKALRLADARIDRGELARARIKSRGSSRLQHTARPQLGYYLGTDSCDS